MHSLLYRALASIVMLISIYFAIQFSQSGFKAIQEFKELERIVPSSILGVLPGEAQVTGFVQASANKQTLLSTRKKVPSVYFRYLKEREERDSDGDKRWVTVQDITRSIDFSILDHSSPALVSVKGAQNTINWSMNYSYHETRGNYRYTEWRIEPDQKVLIFGWAELNPQPESPPSITLRFDQNGSYSPIISKLSAGHERGSLGTNAILNIWGGASLFALGICALMYLLQVHRLLVYLSLMTFVTSGALLSYGITSLTTNVQNGASYLSAKQHQAEIQVLDILKEDGHAWPSWQNLGQFMSDNYDANDWQAERVQEIRLNLFYLHEVYLMQIAQFPENAYAWLSGYDAPRQVAFLDEQERHVAAGRLASYEKTSVRETRYLWMAGGGFLLFSVMAYFGFRFAKVKRMIENVPTSKTKGVAFGIAELKGKVGLIEDHSLLGPLSSFKCVWYRYLIQEKRGSGKHSKWVTISDDSKGIRFYCEDDEGKLLIDATDAEVITRHKKTERSGSMRYTEWALKNDDDLYALGQATVDPLKGDQLLLNKPDKDDIFILSNYSERDIMIKKATSAMLALVVAFSGIFFFATFVNGINGQFSAIDYLISGLLGPVFLIGFTIVLHYNDIIFLKQRAERNWANIQVSLKKRADLFKQLEKVVSKYLKHEKDLLNDFAKLRTRSKKRVTNTGQIDKRINAEHRFVKELNIKAEAYPELKADQVMRDFFDTMTSLETEISFMRQGFNDAVKQHNTRIQSFPDLIMARMFKFKKLYLLSFDTNFP